MNWRHLISASLVAIAPCLVLGGPSGQGGTRPNPELQQRIDALLKRRLKPEALPVNPPNPFQPGGTARREAPADESPAKPPVTEDAANPVTAPAPSPAEIAANPMEVLISCATKLKLGGILVLKDQIQIVVNGVPRREGDVIAADWNNQMIFIRITRLLPGQMILRYADSEVTVKF